MDGNETCKACAKSFKSILKHIGRAKKCKEVYGDEFEKLKRQKFLEKNKVYHSNNKEVRNQKQSDDLYHVIMKCLSVTLNISILRSSSQQNEFLDFNKMANFNFLHIHIFKHEIKTCSDI